MERDLTLKGKIFSAVESPNSFILGAAKKFVRNGVPDHTEISAIILPYATKIEFTKNSGSWEVYVFDDRNEKPKTQKMLVMCINEGKTFEMNIPGQGIFVLSYDGQKMNFQPKKEFNEKEFEKTSASNIAEKNRIRNEAIIAANKKRDEERMAEQKKKQSASVKPFAIDLDDEVAVQPMVTTKVVVRKGGTEKKYLSDTDETFRPFAKLKTGEREEIDTTVSA